MEDSASLHHLLPTFWRSKLREYIESDIPSFDFAGFVVGGEYFPREFKFVFLFVFFSIKKSIALSPFRENKNQQKNENPIKMLKKKLFFCPNPLEFWLEALFLQQ